MPTRQEKEAAAFLVSVGEPTSRWWAYWACENHRIEPTEENISNIITEATRQCKRPYKRPKRRLRS